MKRRKICLGFVAMLALATAHCSSPVPAADGGDAHAPSDAGDGGDGGVRARPLFIETSIPGACADLSGIGMRANQYLPGSVSTSVDLPFRLSAFGETWGVFSVSSHGYAQIYPPGFGTDESNAHTNRVIPMQSSPDMIAAVLWDHLAPMIGNPGSDVWVATLGTAPSRTLVIEWRNWAFGEVGGEDSRVTFQLKIFETTNVLEYHYCSLVGAGARPEFANGSSATIGIGYSSIGVLHSFNMEGAVMTGSGIRYTPER